MNKNKLKVYAPQAREEFIKVISDQAAFYGITAKKIESCEVKGDYAFISGKPFPKTIDKSRDELVKRIKAKGFSQVMEEVAYTWFNRFAAIRFMEINGYLSHGYRVLSHPDSQSEPEILEKAQYLERLDGLEKEEIIALKTAGNKDAELYRKLIIAQCNELHSAMPFLFEKVDDPTELLLPDNLLNTDSVIRQMVDEIPEEDWAQVEIIGWLYQFYISDKKDALMKAKKAYKTEDIPAVTQLFTPNWIVKYLVQNSFGAKWMATYPSSSIKTKMEYYIEPAEQTDEVKQQLREITPDSLNPEELTVMDPACGSGHILVEAYNLLKDIYLERGYRPKDIPALILTKNLFGLEIDDRAAQLAGFALMMKAREDDRQIFEKQIKPNILVLKSASAHVQGRKQSEDINQLIDLFENASTFGSLIRVPDELILKLSSIKQKLEHKKSDLSAHDVFTGAQYYEDLLVLVKQAEFLSRRYDCVIANPPYMGGKYMNGNIKEFATTQYPNTKSDLFSMFIDRGFELSKDKIGFNAMVTMQSWMFLSSFEKCRELWIQIKTITTMAHLGARAFSTIGGEVVTVTAFTFINNHIGVFKPFFLRLIDGTEEEKRQGIINKTNAFTHTFQDEFRKIPGSPIAYWASERMREIFLESTPLIDLARPCQGMATTNNSLFVRNWQEVNVSRVGFCNQSEDDAHDSGRKWFPYNKGGDFRKWYGNHDFIVNYENKGKTICDYIDNTPGVNVKSNGRVINRERYFLNCISWSKISSSNIALRYYPNGFIFDVAGCSIFSTEENLYIYVGFLNSILCRHILKMISPTLNFEVGHINMLPILKDISSLHINRIKDCTQKMIGLAKKDWDSFETSWNFDFLPFLATKIKVETVQESYANWDKLCATNIQNMKHFEEENNKLFIEAYRLQDELTPDVPEVEITLARANKEDDMKRLISYSIGCMMGRYSLDKPGLIYAHSGNDEFDVSQYKSFPADDDGIIPITDHEWFDDDASCRFFKFIEIAWDKKGLDANLDFIAEAIGHKANESSREAIRRYFVDSFYKDHCQTYKKRPIYWLFTSGKEKAFQALVYLHRYNEGTLARMRTEYVLPLQTKINRHIEHLEKDKDSASSTSAANKIQKEIAFLLKQKDELIKFDERLRHYADMKIKLDLDDGVKVNYGKFGELLADVKSIVGKMNDE